MSDTYQAKVRPEKVRAVDEIKQQLDASSAVMLTEYRGLTVGELATLRTELLKADVAYKVVKNTLARLAANDLGLGELDPLFEGPTAIAYCTGDPVLAAKTLSRFAKDHPALVIKGAVLDGRVMTSDEAASLATVDSLEVSLAKIAGSLTSSLQAIVGVLEAPLQRILYVLDQASSWATASGEAPAAETPAAEAPAAEAPEAEAPEAEAPQAEAPEAEAPEAEAPEAEESVAEAPAEVAEPEEAASEPEAPAEPEAPETSEATAEPGSAQPDEATKEGE